MMIPQEPEDINHVTKLVASARKSESNRRNALRSTGPKSPNGKRRSSWNSLKHGLLSKVVVITAGDGAEDPNEFAKVLAAFRQDLEPVGILEESLVEAIAICHWRLRRALRCEVGEIRRNFVKPIPSPFSELDLLAAPRNPELEMIRDHLALPMGPEMDRILRYETTIQRQFNQAINQLERLQRARRGEQIPPPITVQVSGDK